MAMTPPGITWDDAPAPGGFYMGPDPLEEARKRAEEERKRRAAERSDVTVQSDLTRDAMLNQLTAGQIAAQDRAAREDADKAEKIDAAKISARRELIGSIQMIDQLALDAADGNGLFETGFSGAMLRGVPGTASYSLKGKIEPIKARTALDTLIKAKDAGATFGALNEKEFAALGAKIANLDPDMDHKEFLNQVTEIKKFYRDALVAIDPKAWDDLKYTPGIRFDKGDRGYITKASGPDDRDPLDPLGYDKQGGGLSLGQLGQGLAQGVGNAVNGAMALPEMLINPVGQALYNATGYGDQRYDASDSIRGTFGIPQGARGINSTMQEGAISALTGAGLARGMSGLYNGVTGNVLNTVGRTPIRDAAAGAGAGAGMELGGDAGQYLGGDTGRAIGNVAGGLAGGVAGYGAANRVAGVGGPRAPNARMQAADDLGIRMMPADVGGAATKMATGAFGSTLGNIPMVAGAQKSLASASDAVGALTNRMGGASDPQGAGQALRRGFKDWEAKAKAKADDLYSRISVPAAASVELGTTRGALAEMTGKFRSNPKLANVWRSDERLSRTLDALVPEAQPVRGPDGQITMQQVPGTGQLSWADMNAFRSQIGEIIGRPGIKSDGAAVGELKNLYRALSQDMERTAAASGPRALTEWKRAVGFERGREKRQEDVFAVLFGDKDGRSDEKVFGQIGAWSNDKTGDFKRLARAMRSMPKEEAETVRATWVMRAGRASKANQDGVESEVFSPKQFAASWHGMDARARNVMFPDSAHRADMEKMVKVMDGMKTADEYTNYSRTGLSVTGALQTGGMFISPVLSTLSAATQLGAGALLSSPRFARLIASTSSLPAKAQGRRLGQQLGVLAGQQGAIGSEASAVLRAMNDNASMVGRSAASTDETDDERKRGY